MTQFEKIISKYTDAEQYFNTAGYYHVATRASEIETRKLIDRIIEREGYSDGLQEHKDGRRTTFTTEDRRSAFYAIPRTFYKQTKEGNVEVDRVEVAWYEYIYDSDDPEAYPIDEKETIISVSADDEARLKELVLLADNANKDFDAIRRTAVNNLFNAEGISTAGDTLKDDDTKKKLEVLQEYADALIEAVSKEDVEHLQAVQYRQITQHWQIVAFTDDDTKDELIRFFSTKYYEGYKDDEANKARQLACVYSNFVNNYVTAIPEAFIYNLYITAKGREERTPEEEELLTLKRGSLDSIRDKQRELSHRWFNEIGGDYVKAEQEETEEEALQLLAGGEAVKQDYTSPKRHLYDITKPASALYGKINADNIGDYAITDIVETDSGQLQYGVAVTVSPKTAKIEHAVFIGFDENMKNITPFKQGVLNTVYSIYEENKDKGEISFTAKQVAKENTRTKNPNPQTVGAYTKAINELVVSRYRIDVTEHLEMKGKTAEEVGIKSAKIGNYMIPARDAEVEMNNGEVTMGYKLIDIPPQLEYAKAVGQIHSVPVEVLDVPVSMTNINLAIRDYLISQIGIIYNPRSGISNNILINTIFNYAGVNFADMTPDQIKKKRKAHVDSIRKMLEYWKQIKYIQYGYRENKRGRTLESITINPRPKKK